jgi:hypothetical protein
MAECWLHPVQSDGVVPPVLNKRNCGFARAVGLAPAREGQPGYWKRHDRDHDGIACEPWGRGPQRFVNTAHVMRHVERHGRRVVLQLLAEPVGEPGEAPRRHAD